MPRKPIDPAIYRFYDEIERVARKFEEDLIATGRYKYIRTDENDRRIYIEVATGHEVPVLRPTLNKLTFAS